MRFFKLVFLSMAILTIVGLANRISQVYDCYTVVMEDPERSRQPVKYVIDCMDSIMTNNRIPCYYKGCK